MNKYKELKVWQNGVELIKKVYQLTATFPTREQYGLISQMNRSAVSVSSNIAEGAGRNSNGEFKQFLGIAVGSLFELETQLIIAKELLFINDISKFDEISNDITSLLNMLFKLKLSIK